MVQSTEFHNLSISHNTLVIHSMVARHLGSYHFVAFTKSTAMKIHVHASGWKSVLTSGGHIPTSIIIGSEEWIF